MEHRFIHHLRDRLPAHPQLRLGVGDDAAVLKLAEHSDCVVTTDLLADGTHFRLESDNARRIGRKALAVNLSDLAAMAARPVAAVISLCLPSTNALPLAQQLYEGLLPLAEQFNIAIAGGDTNCWSGGLVISVTAIGETTSRGPLRRDGAQVGDAILVTGELGGSPLGKHFDFTPRVAAALLLHERYDLHAGMDISDGLALDLSRLCDASGCGTMLELDAIPISDAANDWAIASGGNRTALDHALSDGEDFELLFTAPQAVADALVHEQPLGIRVTNIGHCIDEAGLWALDVDGATQRIAATGFEHQ